MKMKNLSVIIAATGVLFTAATSAAIWYGNLKTEVASTQSVPQNTQEVVGSGNTVIVNENGIANTGVITVRGADQ